MEKRLFLAIGLSFVVVWLWSAVAPSPARLSKNSNITQHIEDKRDKEVLKNVLAPSAALNQSKIQEISKLSSDKLTAEFSNIGGSLSAVVMNEFGVSLPIENIAGLQGYENEIFLVNHTNDTSISYTYENNDFKIVRYFSLTPGEYIIKTSTKLYNKSDMSKVAEINIYDYIINMAKLDINYTHPDATQARDRNLYEYVVFDENDIFRKAGAYQFHQKEKKETQGKVYWAGFRDRYFCAIVKPQFNTTKYVVNPMDDKTMQIITSAEKATILPNQFINFDSTIFVGPERMDILKNYNAGFEKIKRYYRFGLFDGIAKIISSFMYLIYKFIPNWGVTIVLISTIIYFAMYPLTLKGMMSMKRMQALQPMIMQLKEKNKDNPQKLNKEMMELYKQNKVNPMGGCLPMLLQMPVFIGLYQVLWRSVSFKGAKFLWIKDLSGPDRLFITPFKMPLIGNEFNLLPILIAVIMFVQQKFTSRNMVITDPNQAAQQKMMGTIMPFFIGFIFYKFASGLTLYFTMFYIFSTFSQWKMSKVVKRN